MAFSQYILFRLLAILLRMMPYRIVLAIGGIFFSVREFMRNPQ